MAQSKLKKIHFQQAGKCFYCREPLTLRSASLDHLTPKFLGGLDNDDNLVCCCVAINQLFANIPLKQKIDVLLSWGDRFQCLMKPKVIPEPELTPVRTNNSDISRAD